MPMWSLDALAEFDGEDISSRVFDSMDKPLISVHGSTQYRRQRAIDLVRHFRSSRSFARLQSMEPRSQRDAADVFAMKNR